MDGLMQDWPLRLHRLIDHAAIQHGDREVVSRSIEGTVHRTTYAQLRLRALRVAKRLVADGIGHGDRVGTLAWNTWRHMEAWYGIAGAGAVIHTINPRLFPEQIAWIVNHAADSASYAMGGSKWLAVPVLISVAICVLGFVVFNRTAPHVAEDL